MKNFSKLYKCTISTKLWDYQYRLLTHSIVTNRQLFRLKIRNDNLCTFCNLTKETVLHILCTCKCVTSIWDELEQYIQQNITMNDTLDLSDDCIIFNLKPLRLLISCV